MRVRSTAAQTASSGSRAAVVCCHTRTQASTHARTHVIFRRDINKPNIALDAGANKSAAQATHMNRTERARKYIRSGNINAHAPRSGFHAPRRALPINIATLHAKHFVLTHTCSQVGNTAYEMCQTRNKTQTRAYVSQKHNHQPQERAGARERPLKSGIRY